MGEDRGQVVNQPCGYVFTNGSGTTGIGTIIGLVTLDKIWHLDNMDPMMPRLKDLCVSFSLFKLLRCRFARYKITNVGSVRMLKFFCSQLLKDGEHDRVFRLKRTRTAIIPNSSIVTTGALKYSRRTLRLPDHEKKVKVPKAVKICIFDALRSRNYNDQQLSNGTVSLRQSQVGESFLWACNSIGTSDIVLTWHIATSILEVRHPYQDNQEQGICNQKKIAATHMSRYCAYLVTWCPELLPDEEEWSKSLYNSVKEDVTRVLSVWALTRPLTPEIEYLELVQLLSEYSENEVLRNGVRLGKQLVELVEGEETSWEMLSGFWAEMILYIAPSKNLIGHSNAIARGGELITLLWALLFHVGIASRPDYTNVTATTANIV
nr:unnamed protein product [Digitaria exilis]